MQPNEVGLLSHTLKGIDSNATILEWGMGGSTYYLATQLYRDQQLHSIEHNVQWFEDTRKAVLSLPPNANTQVFLHHIPATDSLSVVSNGNALEECPLGLSNYVNFVTRDTKNFDWSTVQLVLVDGIARGAVLASMLTRLRPGTAVLLHDYINRESWYDWAVNLYTLETVSGTMVKLRVPERR
jgi:hypothetical protein